MIFVRLQKRFRINVPNPYIVSSLKLRLRLRCYHTITHEQGFLWAQGNRLRFPHLSEQLVHAHPNILANRETFKFLRPALGHIDGARENRRCSALYRRVFFCAGQSPFTFDDISFSMRNHGT